jgi:hypothetical protein
MRRLLTYVPRPTLKRAAMVAQADPENTSKPDGTRWVSVLRKARIPKKASFVRRSLSI